MRKTILLLLLALPILVLSQNKKKKGFYKWDVGINGGINFNNPLINSDPGNSIDSSLNDINFRGNLYGLTLIYHVNRFVAIKGEFDIELDDGIYDIKTASPFAFENKFKPDDAYERIKESDAFGYVTQGHGYGMASDKPFKGWIALNKSTGEITIAEAKDTKQEREDVYDKIQHTYKSISKRKAFRRCFTDVEEVFYKKPTGNRTLGIECSYCPYKTRCWKNLEFKRQLPSKGRNPKWIWYTHITEEWRNHDDSV